MSSPSSTIAEIRARVPSGFGYGIVSPAGVSCWPAEFPRRGPSANAELYIRSMLGFGYSCFLLWNNTLTFIHPRKASAK